MTDRQKHMPVAQGTKGRTPPADPSDIELCYTHRHHWDDIGEYPEKWWVSASVPDAKEPYGKPPASHVGSIEIVVVDVHDPYAFDILDGDSADLGIVGGAVLDIGNMQSHGLQPDLQERLMLPGGQLLILSRAELAPEWRGFGIGVLIAGLAIKRLSRSCCAAAVYPGLLYPTEADDDAKRAAAVARLGEVWAQLGFEHFQDGVHVLDLATVTLDEAIKQLRERLARYQQQASKKLET